MKRIICMLLIVVLLCAVLPQISVGANAVGEYNAQIVVSLANQHVNGEWPNGWCLAYIATIFNQSYGLDGNVYSSCCAYQNGNRFIDSASKTDIPLGACVYFGGSDVVCSCGNYAGHVAVHVGNNNVVHAWAGRIVCTSIDYVINCGYPYRGYGWYADQALQSACNHNYTSVETPATCAEEGTRKYTCSLCGDAYDEPIEALGHNYAGVKTEATCTTVEFTTYTCSRCGDSYVEDGEGWSRWSTEYPAGISADLIEQKTQYSMLEKEFTTSTSGTLEGWISLGKTYGDWGAVQTTTTKPTESDTLRITNTTQTGWGYYHNISYYNNGWWIDSIACGAMSQQHYYTSPYELPAYSIQDQGNQQSYGGGNAGVAHQCITWCATGGNGFTCGYTVWFRNPSADVYTYSYQTRNEVNLFYKWGDTWSDWSDEEVISNENCQVKTRVVYRYANTLGHSFTNYVSDNNATYEADGTKTAKCDRCDATDTITDPGTKLQAKNGWVQESGKWYYYKNNVKQTGWVLNGNTWYYMNSNGVMQTGWVQDGKTWYYMNTSGAMVTGWLQQGSTWYYLNSSGAMVTGWLQTGGTWYYFNSSGAMATGWLQTGGVWYYFKSSGAMVTGWQSIGGVWYYFQSGGNMVTGWLKQGGIWYYFKSSGAMATGSVKIGNKTYNFNSSGACLNP